MDEDVDGKVLDSFHHDGKTTLIMEDDHPNRLAGKTLRYKGEKLRVQDVQVGRFRRIGVVVSKVQ